MTLIRKLFSLLRLLRSHFHGNLRIYILEKRFFGEGFEIEPFVYFEFDHLLKDSPRLECFCSPNCKLSHSSVDLSALRHLRESKLLFNVDSVDFDRLEATWASYASLCSVSKEEVTSLQEFSLAIKYSNPDPLFDIKSLESIINSKNNECHNALSINSSDTDLSIEVEVGCTLLVWSQGSASADVIPLRGTILDYDRKTSECGVAWDTGDENWNDSWPSVDFYIVLLPDLYVKVADFDRCKRDGVWTLDNVESSEKSTKKMRKESDDVTIRKKPSKPSRSSVPESSFARPTAPSSRPVTSSSPSMRRIPPPEKPPANGDQIEVLFRDPDGKESWFAGTIRRVTSDGTTCLVYFDDGDGQLCNLLPNKPPFPSDPNRDEWRYC